MQKDEKLFYDLVESLKKSALTINKSERFADANSNYNKLKNDITERLEKMRGVAITNPESYINKKTGEFVNICQLDLSKDNILKHMFTRFITLYNEKQSYGYKEELNANIEAIISSSPCSDLKKEVVARYGKIEGKKFIEDAILQLEDFEKEKGLNVYSAEIKFIKALNKIKTLYSDTPEIIITSKDNVIVENVKLKNEDDEFFYMKKSGQITYNGNVYLVLELVDKSNCKDEYEFYFYIVTNHYNGQKFVMQLDEDINDIVYDKYERFNTQTQIELNRNKNK